MTNSALCDQNNAKSGKCRTERKEPSDEDAEHAGQQADNYLSEGT